MLLSLRHLVSLAAVAAAVACADESSAPSVTEIAGAYTATAFTATANGITTDLLAEDVLLTITLAPNGVTTGTFSVAGAAIDMAGTWVRTGNTVRFMQSAETFVRLMPFEVITNQLRGEAMIAGNTLRVTLSKPYNLYGDRKSVV